ncbi:MAG: hypothetical protein U5Q44_04250 [Dehalococcoidia bacterium]|nr:hypothetical protein [Dehalococcoidia bacterium]
MGLHSPSSAQPSSAVRMPSYWNAAERLHPAAVEGHDLVGGAVEGDGRHHLIAGIAGEVDATHAGHRGDALRHDARQRRAQEGAIGEARAVDAARVHAEVGFEPLQEVLDERD